MKIFWLVALLAAAVHGTDLGIQVEEASTEIARIRTEHRAEVATLKAVIEDLQAELRNSVATADELRAKLALGSMKTTGAFELQTSASGKASKKKGKASKEGCDDHCQSDCGIPRLVPKSQQALIGLGPTARFLDAQCKISDPLYEAVKKGVKFVGTKEHPKWRVFLPQSEPKDVECPCESKGSTLDSDAAMQRILGQVAAIGVPDGIAKVVVAKQTRGEFLVMRLGYAVTHMFKCWQASCSATSAKSTAATRRLLQTNADMRLEDLMLEAESEEAAGAGSRSDQEDDNLQDDDMWGGGVSC